ncbi:hypothetical protein, partial [Rhodopseudomonas palustris]|uniref:hypothetical protein n=1 Tax=Rhodopseudomonas palustris TaxID=1076 RepID=UPI001AEBC22F
EAGESPQARSVPEERSFSQKPPGWRAARRRAVRDLRRSRGRRPDRDTTNAASCGAPPPLTLGRLFGQSSGALRREDVDLWLFDM